MELREVVKQLWIKIKLLKLLKTVKSSTRSFKAVERVLKQQLNKGEMMYIAIKYQFTYTMMKSDNKLK